MPKILLPAELDEISKGTEFIETTLRKYRLKNKAVMEALLISEESMVRTIRKAKAGAQMQIAIRYHYGTADITISAAGAPFEEEDVQIDLSAGDMGHDSEEMIRTILLRAFSDKMLYSRKGEYNFVKISIGERERVFLIRTLTAMTAGLIAAGLILLFASEQAEAVLAEQILIPIQTIYLNALQLVTAPTVFFCILTNISKYASFSDPGRVSRKIIVGYLFTSVIAVLIGLTVFDICQPLMSAEGLLIPYVGRELTSIHTGNTILEMIVNIVPTNIISPFFYTDATQLLFIALLGGIVLGGTGRYTKQLREAADALDSFFSGIAGIVSSLIPTATFFTTILSVIYFDFGAFTISAEVFALTALGLIGMFLFYFLLVSISRLNPITFLRKYAPSVRSTFLGGSSIRAIPETMRVCEKKLGVSPMVYSFSIPFGAIGNMDGNCVYLTIVGLYMARLCGADFLGHEWLTIIFVVVVLSVGSPISSGSVMVAMTMLMNAMGASPVAISFIIGVNVLIEMMLTVCNTTGDVAITIAVARTEGLLNVDVYRAKDYQKKP